MKRANLIDISGPVPSAKRERLFARASGNGFQAFSDAGETVIEVFDEIGQFGVTASEFRSHLASAKGGDVVVKLNSPGGAVFEGLSIFNELVAYRGHVRIEIVGIAASIASVIAMAGDEIAIADNAFLMVHRAWGITVGNEADHTEQAAILAKIDKALAETYARRTGKSAASMHELMNAETWLSAKEAKSKGFADEILGTVEITARFDLSAFNRAPGALTKDPVATQIASQVELEKLLRDRCGLAKAAAKKIATGGFGALSNPNDEEDRKAVQALVERLASASAELKEI